MTEDLNGARDQNDRQCRRKVRYPDRARARYAANEREARGAGVLRVYRCPYCLGWHMTNRAKGRKARSPGRRDGPGRSDRERLDALVRRSARHASAAARLFAEAARRQREGKRSRGVRNQAKRSWRRASSTFREIREVEAKAHGSKSRFSIDSHI